ncbi:MAG: ABC transporter substrate-binding protein [Tissierellia bacterium]|nr:ABC transporter substrate-binding protein [Tissierellia bacterium]
MIKKTFLFLAIIILFFSCPQNVFAKDNVYIDWDLTNKLESALKSVIKDRDIKSVPDRELGSFLEEGGICQVHEDKLVDYEDSLYYKRLYRSTVIIAVNRDLVSEDISSWKDLSQLSYDVYMPANDPHIVTAIAYGLSDGDLDLSEAYSYIKSFIKDKRYQKYEIEESIKRFPAPIAIIFDNDAAALKSLGKNIEIVVPKEGTLYFDMGLVSKNNFNYDEDLMNESLKNADFRLSDGSFSNPIYEDLNYEYASWGGKFNKEIYYDDEVFISMNRIVYNTRLLGPASNNETIAFHLALICLSITWGAYSYHRVLHKKIRVYLLIISIACALWSSLKILRSVATVTLGSSIILWYLYYVPILTICMISLWIALSVDKSLEENKLRIFKLFSLALSLFFLILVLTNNSHKLVFTFPSPLTDKHRYNTLFYPIFVWEIVSLVLTLLILCIKAFYMPNRRTLLIPLSAGIFMLGFMFLYHIGWSVRISQDITFTSGIVVILIYELCMRTWLIPTNSEYRQIFSASTISMNILNNDRETLYAAAVKLEGADIERIEVPIVGGYAVRYEDRTLINELNSSIENVVMELEQKYEVLKQRYAIEQELLSLRSRNKIVSQVEKNIEPELIAIDEELNSIIEFESPHSIDKLAILAYRITVVKQRSNLLLIQMITQEIRAFDLIIACHACANIIEDYVSIDIFHSGEESVKYSYASQALLFFSDVLNIFLPNQFEVMANFKFYPDKLNLHLFIAPKGDQVFGDEFCKRIDFSKYDNLDINCDHDEDGYRFIAKAKRGEDYV